MIINDFIIFYLNHQNKFINIYDVYIYLKFSKYIVL